MRIGDLTNGIPTMISINISYLYYNVLLRNEEVMNPSAERELLELLDQLSLLIHQFYGEYQLISVEIIIIIVAGFVNHNET